jgi:WD40 repeat protein
MSNHSSPRFELQSIYDDGTESEAVIVPVTHVPLDTTLDRRGALKLGGVLGSGISAALLFNPSPAGAQGKPKTEPPSPTTAAPSVGQHASLPKKPLAKVRAHRSGVTALSLSSDGEQLISGDQSANVKLWSVRDGKLKRKLKVGYGAILALAFDRTHTTAFIVTSRSVTAWSLASGRSRSDNKIRGTIRAGAISPDRRFAVLGTSSGSLLLYPIEDQSQAIVEARPGGSIQDLRISKDGRLLVVNKNSTVELFSLPDLKRIAEIRPRNLGGRRQIEISPDQRSLAVAGQQPYGVRSGKISLWKLPDAQLRQKLKELDEAAGPLFSFSTREDQVQDGTFGSQPGGIRALEFFSHEPILITGGRRTGHPRSLYGGSRYRRPRTQKHNPASENTIRIWSTSRRNLLQSLAGNDQVSDLELSNRDRLLASSGSDGTIMIWDRQDLDGRVGFKFRTFLFDPETMDAGKEAVRFDVPGTSVGQTISYTLPCGSPIPAGAVCTCNCVPGTYKRPTYHSRRYQRGNRRSYTYCRCNKICTCIPVCQAHKLLHEDATVRLMAEQILFMFGRREFAYMRWAANQSSPQLRDRIFSTMRKINDGARPEVSKWPELDALARYLDDSDEIVRIMAAQISAQLACIRQVTMTAEMMRKVADLAQRSRQLNWIHAKARSAKFTG